MSEELAGQGPVKRRVRPDSEAARLVEYLKGYPCTDGVSAAIRVILEQAAEIERLRAVAAELERMIGPLPKDHWLYAPRGEWDNARDEFAECPLPILTNAQVQAVTAAARYAIRGATMCGQDQDFDPDAMVLNMVYALCGPAWRTASGW